MSRRTIRWWSWFEGLPLSLHNTSSLLKKRKFSRKPGSKSDGWGSGLFFRPHLIRRSNRERLSQRETLCKVILKIPDFVILPKIHEFVGAIYLSCSQLLLSCLIFCGNLMSTEHLRELNVIFFRQITFRPLKTRPFTNFRGFFLFGRRAFPIKFCLGFNITRD